MRSKYLTSFDRMYIIPKLLDWLTVNRNVEMRLNWDRVVIKKGFGQPRSNVHWRLVSSFNLSGT